VTGSWQRGITARAIDLGDEPPLSLDEDDGGAPLPMLRGVSWRWLTGTILTGVTSMALMGTALLAAIDKPHQLAALPEAAATAVPQADAVFSGQKGDRMQPLEEQVSSRQVLQVSTVTRRDEQDFIRLRPFAKINATLATSDEFAGEVPPFDVLRVFADTPDAEPTDGVPVTAADDAFYGANVDGEVAVKVVAFPLADPNFEPLDALPTPQVEQIVRAAANVGGDNLADLGLLAYADPALLDGGAADGPFADVGVSITPENVSNVIKSDAGFMPGHDFQERVLTVADEGDLGTLLKDNDIADADLIVGSLESLVDVSRMRQGQKVRVAFAVDESGEELRPIRASIYEDGAHQATVARADNDAFVRADEPAPLPLDFDDAPIEAPASGGLPRIYDAVYQTALQQEMPAPLVEELIRIFAFDVDLQARITPGDSIEVFHSLPDASDPEGTEPEILYASLTLNGEVNRFYRFRTGDDGMVDYYDADGNSAKKFLIRKPVSDARITSGYGYRRHPIVGRTVLHTGVDYAAPRGTPILAAGDGVVLKAGRSSGYGNFTLIAHTNGYETAYGHQNAFAKGIVPGAHVHQGQVIGYVGSTGLSTGPHLHFEIRINGKPVDPLRIRLPRGRVLQGDLLVAFTQERDRVDALLGNTAPTTLASAN
jgi:murein DD-endopeptidase MepM/ murein hydrolase activator NlpD